MSDTPNEAVEPVEEVEQDDHEQVQDVDQVEDQQSDEDSEDQDNQDFDREDILKKLRKKNSENRNLRKAKKEAEDKATKAGEDSERVQALEAVNSRYETLADEGLPLKLAKWISSTDRDEILEEAEELLSLGDRGNKAPPTNTPKERVNQSRQSSQQVDEIGDLDDFAASIFKD